MQQFTKFALVTLVSIVGGAALVKLIIPNEEQYKKRVSL